MKSLPLRKYREVEGKHSGNGLRKSQHKLADTFISAFSSVQDAIPDIHEQPQPAGVDHEPSWAHPFSYYVMFDFESYLA